MLKSSSGERLWGGDFELKFKLGRVKDVVKYRAQNIADALSDAWKKSVKEASQSPPNGDVALVGRDPFSYLGDAPSIGISRVRSSPVSTTGVGIDPASTLSHSRS
jgi:hypothetical protein